MRDFAEGVARNREQVRAMTPGGSYNKRGGKGSAAGIVTLTPRESGDMYHLLVVSFTDGSSMVCPSRKYLTIVVAQCALPKHL